MSGEREQLRERVRAALESVGADIVHPGAAADAVLDALGLEAVGWSGNFYGTHTHTISSANGYEPNAKEWADFEKRHAGCVPVYRLREGE